MGGSVAVTKKCNREREAGKSSCVQDLDYATVFLPSLLRSVDGENPCGETETERDGVEVGVGVGIGDDDDDDVVVNGEREGEKEGMEVEA